MNRILRVGILLFTVSLSHAAPSIRRPSMPRGLTSDKTPSSKATNETRKPVRAKKRWERLSPKNKRRTLSTMNFEELQIAKDEAIKKNRFDSASRFLDRMIKLCEDVSMKAHLLIELADIYYNQQQFADAKKQYQEFESLYPGNPHIEYAKKQIILCTKQTILSSDRDQAPTEQTLQLAHDYLAREGFTKYRSEVANIKKECETLLAEAECGITEFYIKQGNYNSAQRRIQHIRDTWLEKVPEIASSLAQLEVSLGAQWHEFNVPEESIKLAAAPQANTKSQKKVDMTTRF